MTSGCMVAHMHGLTLKFGWISGPRARAQGLESRRESEDEGGQRQQPQRLLAPSHRRWRHFSHARAPVHLL
jgi:hypothetical protein